MSESDGKGKSDHPDGDDDLGRTRAGAMLREARLAAGLDAARLAADLRISLQAFEALENSQYHLLPGDPYVRALLSSLARQLHLDPQIVIKTYLGEMGVSPSQGQVAPYQDRGESLTSSHRQILIGLMVLLLIGFVVVLRQLNKPNPAGEAVLVDTAQAGSADTLVLVDSVPESLSLLPDTALDSAVSPPSHDSASPVVSPPMVKDTAVPAPKAVNPETTASATTAALPAQSHVAEFKTTGDSVWVKVMRDGKPDDIRLLKAGDKAFKVPHNDTLRIALSDKGLLEMTLDGKVLYPKRKRFKVMGQHYKPY